MNSIKFSAAKEPKIDITISYEAINDPVRRQQGWLGYMKTEVVDNGKGIARKKQDTLFYMFKGHHSHMMHGVGVGLSTARVITKALGVTIKLDSKKNKGTTVTFTTLVHSKQIELTQKELNKQNSTNEMSLVRSLEQNVGQSKSAGLLKRRLSLLDNSI